MAVFSFPSRENGWRYIRVIATQLIFFAVVYGGCNWLTAQRSDVGHYYFWWELNIPFIPSMIWVYQSVYFLFFAPMFLFSYQQVSAINRAFGWVTVIGGVCFLVFPGIAGFARVDFTAVPGIQAWVFRTLYHADNVHNVMPSLHVAYCSLVILALNKNIASQKTRAIFWCWLAAIVSSTVLVHQHHLIDLPTGAVLGYAGYRLFLRWSKAA